MTGALASLLVAVLAGVAPALADEPATGIPPGRMSVLGHAEIELPPDYAAVTIGIVTRAPSAAAALDANSTAAAKVADLAKALGVADREIGTTAVSLTQAYKNVRDPGGGYNQQPDGYEAQNGVRVQLSDFGRLGELMRRALDGGANRIESVSFGLADPARAERDAAAAAAQDATARAKAVAEASGTALGPVLRIDSPPRRSRPEVQPMAALRAMPAPAPARGRAVPLQAGTVTVSADVEIEWALRQP